MSEEYNGNPRAALTDMVETWIINDGQYYFEARERARDGAEELGQYLRFVLRVPSARNGFAEEVANELAPNDYDRIDWQQIAETLLAE